MQLLHMPADFAQAFAQSIFYLLEYQNIIRTTALLLQSWGVLMHGSETRSQLAQQRRPPVLPRPRRLCGSAWDRNRRLLGASHRPSTSARKGSAPALSRACTTALCPCRTADASGISLALSSWRCPPKIQNPTRLTRDG